MSTNPSIPTEAIEAAMSAADGLGRDGNNSWSDAAIMRAALSAAAPFIAAESLREAAFELPAGLSRKGFYNWLRARADQLEGKTK